MTKISPMMEQYLSVKEDYPGKIVFFQVGDFYELFYEDARIASRELDLVLTTRDADKKNPVPMAGLPIHAIDNYLSRMIEKGYKVVICDQAEDASQAKGLVKREVSRIVTPGTVIDENMLHDTRNNYIISLQKDGDSHYGMAIADVSTGGFWATEISGDNAKDLIKAEWQRILPAEVICSSWMVEDNVISECRKIWDKTLLEEVPENYFTHEKALEAVVEQWGEKKTTSFVLHNYPLAVSACGALITYLKTLQKTGLAHLKPVELYFPGEFMLMDGITRRNLELTQTIREGKRKGSLLGVIDYTCTSMGGRLLKRWVEQPLKDIDKINGRIEAVDEMFQKVSIKKELRDCLGKVFDLERLCSRVNFGSVNARDLVALKNTLNILPQVKIILQKTDSILLQDIASKIPDFTALTTMVEQSLVDLPPITIREGGIIKEGYNEEIDRLRIVCRQGKNWLIDIEKQERESTGIKTLKIGYNRIYGYYLEVTKNNLHLIPQNYHRKQTLVNAERFITEKLKKVEEEISGSNEKLIQLEFRLFEQLREEVVKYTQSIQLAAQYIAETDCLQGLGEAAPVNKYCKPEIAVDNPLEIKQGRHPVIEKMNLGERFVPNDAFLDQNQKMLIITGPNMAGKSTYCRTTALICLLAQIGSFVPASSVKLPVLDRIFARIGASDDLSSGQSTFMVEMNETASILREATPRTLIVLDEIGRGTSTYDGMSIARSVLEYIHNNLGSWTLFSTHYHELTTLEEDFPTIRNYTMAVREKGNTVIFLRKVIPGKADKSYGINVARLAGLPAEVIERADIILKEVEAASNRHNSRNVQQISLFDFDKQDLAITDEANHILNHLKEMKLELISPLEALQELFRIQSELRNK